MRNQITILLLILLPFFLTAQGKKNDNINLDLLINETQKSSNDPSKVNIIWWIPIEFWETSFKDDPTVTEEQVTSMIAVMKQYQLVGVILGKIGVFGGVNFENEAMVLSKTSLKDHYGDIHNPLKKDAISSDMQNFLDIMKPMISNMMGNLGENFAFLVFDAKNSSDKPIIDPLQDHDFEIIIEGDETYAFDLPIGAVLMPKICPEDKVEHNGKWTFCPFHGTKLAEKASE